MTTGVCVGVDHEMMAWRMEDVEARDEWKDVRVNQSTSQARFVSLVGLLSRGPLSEVVSVERRLR